MIIQKRPIGLFGGTFDPIHRGHIKIAEELVEALNLQAMHFIPNKQPIHRSKPKASAQHRLAMVRIATARYPDLLVNDVEIHRPGPSYTIDTLNKIRQQIPNQPLCLILGNDVFTTMNTWHEWQLIPELTHLVIINRPGIPLSYEPWMKTLLKQHEITDPKKLHTQPGGFIFQYEIKPMMISATDIRNKIKAKQDVSKDISAGVLRYIQQHHLYS